MIIVDPKLITLNHASAKGPCLLRYGGLHGRKQKRFEVKGIICYVLYVYNYIYLCRGINRDLSSPINNKIIFNPGEWEKVLPAEPVQLSPTYDPSCLPALEIAFIPAWVGERTQ